MALDAIIFDVDGTLIDTNAAHVEAWRRAFETSGFVVAPDRIAPEIGKGGDLLVGAVLGQSADREHGDALRDAYGEAFLEIAAHEKFKIFPQARELLQALRQRGLVTAIATSADKEYFEALQKSAGVDLEESVDLITTNDDAEASKPEPDLVLATTGKLNLSPAQCAMLGDTPHDAAACKRAGVGCGARARGPSGATPPICWHISMKPWKSPRPARPKSRAPCRNN